MSLEEALKLIQTILYTNTGKELSVVEKAILKAAWDNETYATIAKDSHLSIGHIKDVAYKLWKQLSKILGEKITKTNLRLVLQNKNLSPMSVITSSSWEKNKTFSNIELDLKNHISQLRQEVNELKHTKETLYKSRAFLETILNTSLDGIAAMEAVRDSTTAKIIDFKFSMANLVITKFFYGSHEGLIGKFLLKNKIIKDNPNLFNALVEVVETEKPLYQELFLEINDIQNWYQIIAVILGDGISLIIRNITPRKLLEAELTRHVDIESLTNIANRRRFNEYLAQEWQKYEQKRQPISLILCEINDFESYKNTYGKQNNDECLIQIALSIYNCINPTTGLVAHYQENQFAVILPNTDAEGAFHKAELIQAEVEKLNIPHITQPNGYLTLSLGIANMIPNNHEGAEALIMAAETMLGGYWV